MHTIIQIYPCLLKLSRKQESVTDGQTDRRIYQPKTKISFEARVLGENLSFWLKNHRF
jgi:hypothetical protein